MGIIIARMMYDKFVFSPIEICLSKKVYIYILNLNIVLNIVPADVLLTEAARVSAGMVLT